jgi:UDP-glucuronate 4-epimerase
MIFNSEPIPLLEPESSRDFTYVDDIVDGLVRMLIVRGTSYEIINLGFGRTEKISRVIKLLEKSLRRAAIWGAKIPAPQSDIPASLANTRRAKHLLGWRPSTPLEDGIASFAEWYLAQKRAGPV